MPRLDYEALVSGLPDALVGVDADIRVVLWNPAAEELLISLAAQLEPPSTGGVAALEHERRLLGHYKRVLVIGAHPDDIEAAHA